MKLATGANARSEAHTATPNREHPARQLIGGTNLSNRRMRTRLYGGVAGRDREVPPMPIVPGMFNNLEVKVHPQSDDDEV